jgi:multidrug efflux pump subunit AcrB
VEKSLRKHIAREDLDLIVSEIGLTPDWSAAYTPNAGPMDAVVKVQLTAERGRTSQEYVRQLRKAFAADPDLATLEFSFDSGGLVRGALNEGKSSPINIQLTGKNQDVLFVLADRIKSAVRGVRGIVDARVLQRPDAPQLIINVDRTKAQNVGLNQDDVMKNIIAALNSSITYNKKNFWIDPVSGNQYYVGVQYPAQNFQSIEDLENITITSPKQGQPIPLKNIATIQHGKLPTEMHHVNLQPAIDLTMNVDERDLGHVSDDVARVLGRFGTPAPGGKWIPYDPNYTEEANGFKVVERGGKKVAQWRGASGESREAPVLTEKGGKQVVRWTNAEGRNQQIELVTDRKGREHVVLAGAGIVLTGEYTRMQNTFRNLGMGLILASLLIYFLMVALDRSFIVPLAVMLIVPLCLIGILPMLYVTGSAVNVQSLLGFIFIVGIKVANTVLMTDYAQELRRHEGLSPVAAIRKAAALRVRPVTMTALAAFFAMIPTALALEHGSEANAPLARAILGGLLAGEPATLFVLPALYAILVRDRKNAVPAETSAHAEYEGTHPPELSDNTPYPEPEP